MNKPTRVVPLRIELTDIITPKSCSSLIVEFIKYLAFNKQQIPYPYERLKMYVLKRREREKHEVSNLNQDSSVSVRVSFVMEKYYKKVEEAFEILDNTFQCIEQELMGSNGHSVEEVVLLFGATPISPKDVYRIQIPSFIYGHLDDQHSWKKQSINLLRGIIVSDEVNTNLQCRVGLTNMFVMLKLRRDGTVNSKWLLPKDHYKLSERAQQVCVSFSSTSSLPCSCPAKVEVLAQSMTILRVSDSSMASSEEDMLCSTLDSEDHFVWHQTLRSLKGFKDCKLQGKSVADLWFKYNFI